MYVCTYVHVCMYVCMYIYMYRYVCVYFYTCIMYVERVGYLVLLSTSAPNFLLKIVVNPIRSNRSILVQVVRSNLATLVQVS